MEDHQSSFSSAKFIDSIPFSRYQLLVISLCVLVSTVDAIDMMVMGLVAPALRESWSLSHEQITPILSSSVFGSLLGAILGGPCADRFGRRRVLLVSLCSFGILTVFCAVAPSTSWLVVLRFVAGLGMGAAVPTSATLIAEYAPQSRRSIAVNAQTIGFSIGAAISGILASWVIPSAGWKAMLLIVGLFPLVVAVLVFAFLSESLEFMLVKERDEIKINKLLKKLGVVSSELGSKLLGDVGDRKGRSSTGPKVLVQREFLSTTIVLWLLYFFGLVIYYFFTNWLPVITRDAGFTIAQASRITALFPLGGALGAVIVGLLLDRTSSRVVMGIFYALSGAFIFLVGVYSDQSYILVPLIFLGGMTVVGATFSLPAVAAGLYPTLVRATGVAWMLGMGRLGGISGSILGGVLMSNHWTASDIFKAASVPAFAATILIVAVSKAFSANNTNKENTSYVSAKSTIHSQN